MPKLLNKGSTPRALKAFNCKLRTTNVAECTYSSKELEARHLPMNSRGSRGTPAAAKMESSQLCALNVLSRRTPRLEMRTKTYQRKLTCLLTKLESASITTAAWIEIPHGRKRPYHGGKQKDPVAKKKPKKITLEINFFRFPKTHAHCLPIWPQEEPILGNKNRQKAAPQATLADTKAAGTQAFQI